MKAKGKGFLKVVGILLIIFGAFGMISSISSFALSRTMTEEMMQMMEQLGTPVDSQTLIIAGIIGMVASVVYIVTGIIGIKNCNKPEKAQICFICGIVLIVLELANQVYAIIAGTFGILSLILAFILPVLYFIGANLNRNMSVEN